MRRIAAVLLSFGVAGVAAAGFEPTTGPVSPDGKRATVDLPTSQHMKNVGGSDGLGLCVFTSVQHAERWQSIRALEGFRAWMERRPGGGWPQKLDQTIAQFCRDKGVPVPAYIQHTGGDEQFLELALKTDRVVCVTYAGRDDFYRGRIAHMVNLAHLDGERAAIIDNNRPGVWVWMSRAEFLARWRDMQGGWAVVFLAAPPPPHPAAPAEELAAAGCICGDSCKCEAGKCPGGCPVVVGQCPNGRCPIPAARPAVPVWPQSTTRPEPIGNPPTDRHEWGYFPELGQWGWRFKVEPVAVPAVVGDAENYGVDTAKIAGAPRYSFRGTECSRAVARALLAGGSPLADDSDCWHLTAVGDPDYLAKFRQAVDKLPPDVRVKLHVQGYRPLDWPVGQYKLPAGVSLRKPSPERVAAEVGVSAGCSLGDLLALLRLPGGPLPPLPKPVDPPNPAPVPAPAPDESLPWWLCGLAALLFLFRSEKKK